LITAFPEIKPGSTHPLQYPSDRRHRRIRGSGIVGVKTID